MAAANDRILSALRIADPPAWRAKIRAALRTEGTLAGAVASLGVARSTLFRWLAEDPTLREGIEIRDTRGRPKKSTAPE